MSTTITIPDGLTQRLYTQATNRRLSFDELVIDILANTLERKQDAYPTLKTVVAEIKALGPNPTGFHPATRSLADLLLDSPDDASFDLEEWNREWAKAEAEIDAITRANDLVEGRV